MKFTKMEGAGNDFIIINNIDEQIPREAQGKLAKELCHRRFSIGADGIMFVEPPEKDGDFKMAFYNADGTPGEMCGNGARCLARYGYDHCLAGEYQNIETPAGMIEGHRESKNLYTIRLNPPSLIKLNVKVQVENHSYMCDYIELGNPGIPHAVTEADSEIDMKELGAKIRSHPAFPKGANVNFYKITGRGEIYLMTYERGVEDFTMACGTGAASTVLALKQRGKLRGEEVTVKTPGGQLQILAAAAHSGTGTEKDKGMFKGEILLLRGEANMVAEGIISKM